MNETAQIAPAFLTQHELAEHLQLPERTLEDWRLTHVGPPYMKLAGTCDTTSPTCLPEPRRSDVPRPRLPSGELGNIDVTRLASGRYQARGSTRDDSCALHRLRASADSEEAARADLLRQAMALSTGGSSTLSPKSTIADVVELWLSQILTRANTGSLSYSTYESYETTARVIIVPRCGGVRLDKLTVGRCDRILQKILEEETISKARRARAVLSLVCGYAVRDDALDRNPVRDVQRLPTAPRKESALSTTQIIGIRDLMEQWRVTRDDGPDPTIVPSSTVWKSCSEPRCGSENALAYGGATWT